MTSKRNRITRGVAIVAMSAGMLMGSAGGASASTVLFDKGVLPQYVGNFATICRNLGGHFSTYRFAPSGPFTDVRCTK